MPWDYDDVQYAQQTKRDPLYLLERLINYGLNGEKLDRELLEKHFEKLRIPEDRRAFLEVLLWNKTF